MAVPDLLMGASANQTNHTDTQLVYFMYGVSFLFFWQISLFHDILRVRASELMQYTCVPYITYCDAVCICVVYIDIVRRASVTHLTIKLLNAGAANICCVCAMWCTICCLRTTRIIQANFVLLCV